MPKVEVDIVAGLMKGSDIPTDKVNEVMRKLREQLALEGSAEREPRERKQYVILLSDPAGKLQGLDLAGWIVQIPEEDAPATAVDRVVQAATHFKSTKKGRRRAVATFAEAFEGVPSKVTKEHKLWIKTKEPVFAFAVPGDLPAVVEE